MTSKVRSCTLPGRPARFIGEADGPCAFHRLAAFEAAEPGLACEECGEGLKDLFELKTHFGIFHPTDIGV